MPASEQPRLASAGPIWVPVMALVLALVAGIFAWQQRQRAADLTKQISSLTAEAQEKSAAIQERAASIERLRAENDSYIKESASLREEETNPTSAPPKTGAGPSLSTADKNKVEFAAKTLDDPRAKELRRQQQRAIFKQIYGDFVKQSNLTDEQVEHFYSLSLDEDQRQFDEETGFFNGDGTQSREAEAEEWATRKAELDKELKAILGETGFAKWEAYEKTTGERLLLVRIREQLALNSSPLREDQTETVLRILMEERARAPSTLIDPGAREDPREQVRKLLEGNNADQYYREE